MPNIFAPIFRWPQLVLFFAGITWLIRAVNGLYKPDYWSPRTPLDYAAVVGTSLALILTAFGLWIFHQHHPGTPGRIQIVWRIGVLVSCISAFIIGLSNFIEDALRIEGLSYVWVIGIIVLSVGLLIAGISAFWVQGLSHWVGVLFLTSTLGLFFTEWNGQLGLGLSMVALSFLSVKRS